MSLRKVSDEAFVLSVFSRNQEKTKPLTWLSVRDVVQPPVFVTAALKRELKKTCSHLVTCRPVARAGI